MGLFLDEIFCKIIYLTYTVSGRTWNLTHSFIWVYWDWRPVKV